MELIKENLEFSEVRCKKSTVVYVDGDVIVPDVKPDILKILQVDAVSRITDKEILDGEIRIKGTVKYNILYVPESEEDCIKSITSEMDFSHTIDKIDTSGEIYPKIMSDVERVEFNLLNSRKLNIKTAVGIECVCWGKKEILVSKSIDDERAEAIYDTLRVHKIDVFAERGIGLRDRLEIPAGVSGISEILKMDVSISGREIKAITGKAILKGNVEVSVLYLDMEKNIQSVNSELPFTEIAEIFDLEEDAKSLVEYRVGEYDYQVSMDADGEARCVDFDISIIAEITSDGIEECEIMSDCFCPGKPARLILEEVASDRVVSTESSQHTVKDVVSPDKKSPGITSVYNVIPRPIVTKTVVEDGCVIIEGKTEFYVLYITDNNQLPVYCLKKDVPISIKIDKPYAKAGLGCDVKINPEHIAYNINMANEVEVRCILSVDMKLIEKAKIPVITEIVEEEEKCECGIVIYFVRPGDTLWNIAKRYSVSIDDLKELNEIADRNQIKAGDRLIIPVC